MTDTSQRAAALVDLPLMPRDEDGPVFEEPWQAQAFAMVVDLIESGRLDRTEWAERLGAALKAAEERGDFDTGRRYYDHWLDALETLVLDRQFSDLDELNSEKSTIAAADDHRRHHQLHDH